MQSGKKMRSLPGSVPFVCIVLFLCLAASPGSRAQSNEAGEYEVKAGFLYNFAKFIQWPANSFPNANAPITFCILGHDPFGDSLDEIVQGKTINGRGFLIRRTNKFEELKGCHLIFVSASEASRFGEILDSLKGTSSLIVGDFEGFAATGGAIEFFLEDNKVRFSVNVDALKRARLEMSSKVLALARIIHDTDRPKGA